VLASFSEYFKKRATGYHDDPCTLTLAAGRQILGVAVEEELTEAAAAVIHLMYQGGLPLDLPAEQLAKVVAAPECRRELVT
jgi:hypothetical protein